MKRVTSLFGSVQGELRELERLEEQAAQKEHKRLPRQAQRASAPATDLKAQFHDIDTRCAKLPLLDVAQFSDPDKGLWEFWGMDPKVLQAQGVRARNPASDVRDCNVAIDFGTSSTVVAYDEGGRRKLFRVGVTDFWEKEKPAHYENPTVLEFVDLPAMLTAWRAKAYQPDVLWDTVRCSHEAQANFRNNQTDTRVMASIFTKMKQWALREAQCARIQVSDQTTDAEHIFDPLSLRQPVKGQPLAVSSKDPFDPIELYAWFLGLTINWRGHGIHLRYYMTFPVAYPREVKEKVLASFRRGLQRSLPHTLVGQAIFEQFTVEERASEPAAYAAIALQTLGIEPTAKGVAYAVFDFGGGTTDFDFGYYRLPTDAQADDEGWERVFEHFGSGGDKFLGGENLLENMAYRTFLHNLEDCRTHKITFTRPLDGEDFPGSSMFLQRTQAAATNALMLMACLRPLWEGGVDTSKTGLQKMTLLASDGKKVTLDVKIPVEELQKYLEDRIEVGIRNFYAALKKAFDKDTPDTIHVLLGGNASRSRIVSGFFGVAEATNKPLDAEVGSMSLNQQQLTAKKKLAAINLEIRSAQEKPSRGLAKEIHTLEKLVFDAKTSQPKKSATSQRDLLGRRTQACISALFGENAPKFIYHAPLPIDEGDVYLPTAKTGVALGLLSLCPGSPTLVLNHIAQATGGDAPFLHYVGRIRMGKFHVCLPQGAPYQAWVELGPVRERVFTLVHSQESRAHLGDMKEGEIGLYQKRQDFAGNTQGLRVYARAVSPHDIELCAAASAEAAENGLAENVRRITLG